MHQILTGKMKDVVLTAIAAPRKSQSEQSRYNINGTNTFYWPRTIEITLVNASYG